MLATDQLTGTKAHCFLKAQKAVTLIIFCALGSIRWKKHNDPVDKVCCCGTGMNKALVEKESEH